jgi:uncharacterized protein (DUF3084 family)
MIAEKTELEQRQEIKQLRYQVLRLERQLAIERAQKQRPKSNLLSLAGKGKGVYGSTEQIDAHILELRGSDERILQP